MIGIEDITEEYLSKIEKIGGKEGLNLIAEMDSTVLSQVKNLENDVDKERQPLFGIPIFVKDNIDVKGLHTTAGSLALSDNIAKEDAPVIQALRRKGAVILGKTNMTEFANYTTQGMPGGYSSRGGQVISAINPKLDPSGSSSGSGVAVSSGLVDVALGTDTSFSVIVCAIENSVCGLKPPAGTFSGKGIIPIAQTLDSVGVIGKTLKETLLVYGAMRDDLFGDEIMSLTPADLSKVNIAVNKANEEMTSKEQLKFLERVFKKVKKEGAEVAYINQPPTKQLPIIMQYEFGTQLEQYLKDSNASMKTLKDIVEYYQRNPDIMMKYGATLLEKALSVMEKGMKDEVYLEAIKQRQELRMQVFEELDQYDVAIMTGPNYVMHLCGLPCVSIVSSKKRKDGVKQGIVLYGKDERKLYRTALAIEQMVQ